MSQRETNTTIENMPFIPLSQHHTGKHCKRTWLLREETQAIASGQLRYSPNEKAGPTRKVGTSSECWGFSSLNHLNKIIYCNSSIPGNASSALACFNCPRALRNPNGLEEPEHIPSAHENKINSLNYCICLHTYKNAALHSFSQRDRKQPGPCPMLGGKFLHSPL